ncbi:MAG: type II secretion system F family protein, partial [Planctomycetota bacterium]
MSEHRFHYKAVDRSGNRTKGLTEALDRRDAYRKLVAAGLRPTQVREIRSRRARGGSVSAKDLAVFSYQFSVLLQARVAIVDAIRTIAGQESNARLVEILLGVADRIEAGASVTEAFAPNRDVFGDVYIETLRAAEVSGNMIEVLEKLAIMLEANHEMTKSVKGALIYPACVISALGLAVTFLMIFVVPRFAELFSDRGVELPIPTQVLVGVSGIIVQYWYLIIAAIAGLVLLVRRGWATPTWRRRIDTWMHALPILRPMLQGVAVSRFAHVFGLTLRSGLSLMDALELSGR